MALDRQNAAKFRNACTVFNISNSDTISSLSILLSSLTAQLKTSTELRKQIGQVEPPIWPDLQRSWQKVAAAESDMGDWDGDIDSYRDFVVELGKFTRNLVAGVPENQVLA